MAGRDDPLTHSEDVQAVIADRAEHVRPKSTRKRPRYKSE